MASCAKPELRTYADSVPSGQLVHKRNLVRSYISCYNVAEYNRSGCTYIILVLNPFHCPYIVTCGQCSSWSACSSSKRRHQRHHHSVIASRTIFTRYGSSIDTVHTVEHGYIELGYNENTFITLRKENPDEFLLVCCYPSADVTNLVIRKIRF